jgi:uncharacterized repeat protein (TIGR03803 family)
MTMTRISRRDLRPASILITSLAVLVGCGGSGGGSNSSTNGNSSAFTVGGTITGLGSATGLVLTNGNDTLEVPANATSFVMPSSVSNGQTYDVTVKAHPPALSCSIFSGTGAVNGANVTSIFVPCSPGTKSILYSFMAGTTDGIQPIGSLIQGRDGNFYGVTASGGTSGHGVAFRITPDGTETVLYSFAGGATDGSDPSGSLIQAGDENFYGATASGGTNGDGVAFKVTPDGTEAVLYSFAGGANDGSDPSGSLIQASDGNFYGVTGSGGANGDGVAFKITPDGTETVLYSFAGGTTDGSHPSGSLVQANDGNFYGMTQDGGAYGYGVVFKITPSGTETILFSFYGGLGTGSRPSGSLIQGRDGNLYGMSFEPGNGGGDLGTIFGITLSGTLTFQNSLLGERPIDRLVEADDGNFYGASEDGYNGAIFEITPSGAESVVYSFTDGTYPSGGLIQVSNGDFYGMTSGTVFDVN